MTKKQKEKTYMFYVSDYHFEMIGLLNINKEINENKKVVILTQTNLEKSMQTLLSRTNLKEDAKEKIEKLNWTNEEKNKYKEIAEAIEKDEKISIYIKGNEEYINNQNAKIKSLITNNEENISITDCYNFFDIKDKSKDIIKNYNYRLETGEKIIIN